MLKKRKISYSTTLSFYSLKS